MISFVKGQLEKIYENRVEVDTGALGYEIFVPGSVLDILPPVGAEVKLYTYMNVKEDEMSLFGFLERENLNIFKLLINVNGIGPKGALGILSALTVDDLRFAVLSDDAKSIAKAPGICAKTAQKLIIELKDKLKLEDAFESKLAHGGEETKTPSKLQSNRQEAVLALTALGYSNSDALRAVSSVDMDETTTTEQILKLALQKMMN